MLFSWEDIAHSVCADRSVCVLIIIIYNIIIM